MLYLDLITIAVSGLIALAAFPWMIRLLERRGMGQRIQPELAAQHQLKAGTPTGGGLLFVGLALVGGILASRAGHAGTLPTLGALALFGAIGLADDLAKRKRGSTGIPARVKLPLQVVAALPVLLVAHRHQFLLPAGAQWIYWPLGLLALVGCANAVNLTDGVDGLAAGTSLISLLALGLLFAAPPGERAVAMTLCGGLLAFLHFNRRPARVFMGDSGSLALGAALAAMALQQGWLLLLPLVGLVFLVETLSVMIQVSYFKLSGGRRVFRMTPIHLTFQLAGWSENRIALIFSGVSAASCAAAWAVARALG